MGGKRAGKGKQVHLWTAILILLSPLACSLYKNADTVTTGIKIRDTKSDEAVKHLALGKKYLAQGNYSAALKEHEKVISLAGKNSPTDESLFYIGIIYAHPANPSRDSGKSVLYCRRLIKEFPESSLAEQAKSIIGIIQENEKLIRMVGELNTIIEESKKVDVEIEQKKRKKAK